MTKQTQIRLSLMLLILALISGFTVFPDRKAEAVTCNPADFDCQVCANKEDLCLAGTIYPECGGDYTCCHDRLYRCWACCIWY